MPTTNLEHLCALAAERRWKGLRNETSTIVWAERLVAFLASRGVHALDDITSADMDALVASYREMGNAPQTIKAKLSTLGVMAKIALGNVPPLGARLPPRVEIKSQHRLKWWLNEAAKGKLLAWLALRNDGLMLDYIKWTARTGLRVEETLGVRRSMLNGLGSGAPTLTVPGTKTRAAQTTIPLSLEAATIAERRLSGSVDPQAQLFAVSYMTLMRHWRECREFLGEAGNSHCTLKALRRTFASYVTRGRDTPMPTEALQRYLRHSQIKTTMEYLALVGSADLEGTRKWL